MSAKVISGREVAETILTTDLKNKVLELNKKNIKPKLIVMLVGDMKASASYVAQKEKFAVKAGIESNIMRFEANVTEKEILSQIDNINNEIDDLIPKKKVEFDIDDANVVADADTVDDITDDTNVVAEDSNDDIISTNTKDTQTEEDKDSETLMTDFLDAIDDKKE